MREIYLSAFEKVSLQPGESKTVIFTLDQRCFSYWDEGAHAFRVPGGDYTIEVCQDAATVLLQQEITVEDEYIASGQKYDLMTRSWMCRNIRWARHLWRKFSR